jgi:hypothetical protein
MPRRASRRARVLLLVGLLPVLTMTLWACGDVAIEPDPTPVVGTGGVVTEDRTSGDVERISVAADIEVVVQIGSPVAVTLTAQPDILPAVTTETSDGQLIVNVPLPGYTTTFPVLLAVTTPTLDALTLSGGATGVVRLAGGDLRLDLSGRATIEGTGSLDNLALTSSSNAKVSFAQVTVDTCSINMSGGSAAELHVVRLLKGDASGGATVTLTQPGATVNVTTSSGASVQGG